MTRIHRWGQRQWGSGRELGTAVNRWGERNAQSQREADVLSVCISAGTAAEVTSPGTKPREVGLRSGVKNKNI